MEWESAKSSTQSIPAINGQSKGAINVIGIDEQNAIGWNVIILISLCIYESWACTHKEILNEFNDVNSP